MRVLVLDGELLGDARASAGEDDDVLMVAPTPDELERLQEAQDPRVYYLIGDGEVLPLPDAFVDGVYGTAADGELQRVRR